MTDKLPFTEFSIRKAIRAVRKEGLFVVGVKSDGSLIVSASDVDPETSPLVQQALADAEQRRRWNPSS